VGWAQVTCDVADDDSMPRLRATSICGSVALDRSRRCWPCESVACARGGGSKYSLSTAVLAKTVDYEKDGNGIENPTHMAASGRP